MPSPDFEEQRRLIREGFNQDLNRNFDDLNNILRNRRSPIRASAQGSYRDFSQLKPGEILPFVTTTFLTTPDQRKEAYTALQTALAEGRGELDQNEINAHRNQWIQRAGARISGSRNLEQARQVLMMLKTFEPKKDKEEPNQPQPDPVVDNLLMKWRQTLANSFTSPQTKMEAQEVIRFLEEQRRS